MSLLKQSIRCCLIKRMQQYSLNLHHNTYSRHRLWRLEQSHLKSNAIVYATGNISCLTTGLVLPLLNLGYSNPRFYCSSAISHPTPDGCEKSFPPKILNIVEDIAKLTLIEVADLNECLKKKLNIKDVPMMMGAAPVAAPAAAGDEEGDEPQITKSSFTIKLSSFDPAKKIALIKEVKNLMEGMNLVQAKQFIESSPQIVKADIAKDEAENIKKSLEAVGAVCEIS